MKNRFTVVKGTPLSFAIWPRLFPCSSFIALTLSHICSGSSNIVLFLLFHLQPNPARSRPNSNKKWPLFEKKRPVDSLCVSVVWFCRKEECLCRQHKSSCRAAALPRLRGLASPETAGRASQARKGQPENVFVLLDMSIRRMLLSQQESFVF